jgi:hypothetical protein
MIVPKKSTSEIKFDILELSTITKRMILILYFIIIAFTAIVGVYILTYILLISLFLVISSSMGGYKFIAKFQALPKLHKVLLLFFIALLLRFIMLPQTQIITWDLLRYVQRSENMLAGQLPYLDFYGGNKPPLYEFMLFTMGYLFTPGVIQFRIIFSVFDAMIPVVLFYLCLERYSERFAIVTGFIYALFPIGIICIGLSGHYDCVVALFTLIALFFLFRNKPSLSGLSLGVAFALKIYPAVLLPFYVSKQKNWKDKIIYIISFAIPTIIADGALFILSPQAFNEYIIEESGWVGTSAFSSIIEMMIGTNIIFSVKISWIVLGIFGLLILWLLIDWLSPKREKNLIKWFKIIIIIYVFYYAFYLIYFVLYYDYPLIVALIPLAIYFPIIIFLLHRYLPRLMPDSLNKPKSDELFIVSTFAIMLFLMGLPNIAPWYFIWFFPFLLAIRTDEIRYVLLWIFPWHGIGKKMRLLPGTPRIN